MGLSGLDFHISDPTMGVQGKHYVL